MFSSVIFKLHLIKEDKFNKRDINLYLFCWLYVIDFYMSKSCHRKAEILNQVSLRERCPYLKLFWSVSVQIADQNNSEYGHLLRSGYQKTFQKFILPIYLFHIWAYLFSSSINGYYRIFSKTLKKNIISACVLKSIDCTLPLT